MNEKILEVKDMVVEPLTSMMNNVIAFLPNIVGAIIILIVGYLVSKIIEMIIKKISKKMGINRLSKKAGMDTKLEESNIAKDLSEIFGKVVFWFVMFIFFMSASDTLGLDIVSKAFRTIMLYIPNILASILILLFGFLMANVSQSNIRKRSLDTPALIIVANLVYMIIAVVTLSLAINQLEIETDLLNEVVSIILMSIGVALALSLGLGTRDVASDVISGSYIKELYHVGDKIEVDGINGAIVQIGNIKTTIEVEENKHITISNHDMLKHKVVKDI